MLRSIGAYKKVYTQLQIGPWTPNTYYAFISSVHAQNGTYHSIKTTIRLIGTCKHVPPEYPGCCIDINEDMLTNPILGGIGLFKIQVQANVELVHRNSVNRRVRSIGTWKNGYSEIRTSPWTPTTNYASISSTKDSNKIPQTAHLATQYP